MVKLLNSWMALLLQYLQERGVIKNDSILGGYMELSCPEFNYGEQIPQKFTCDGDNVNPPLRIAEIPSGTQSLTLFVDDPDAPSGLFTHWIVFDISPQVNIEQNSIPGKQGKNTTNRISYFGPCPPPNQRHRYYFRLFALDLKLNIPAGSTRKHIERSMEGHILANAELVGYYR